MTNRWKIAFFILLIISVTSIGLLGYTVIDQAVTINYASEGRADVEAHRDILDALIIGKLNLKDIRAANPKANHQANGYSHEVTYKDVRFQFDKQGRYIGSEYGASVTPRYDPKKD